MKHLFLINPVAGKYDHTGEVSQCVREVCGQKALDYEILVSRSAGDCTKLTQVAGASGQEVRIYACGGDGTLNEVVNGAVGCPNVAVTHFPCGSGNDFVRCFSEPDAFHHLDRLLDAEEASFDLISCNGRNYSLNICSMGLDARIGTGVSKYKRLPLVSGSSAYLLSTGVNVVKGINRRFTVQLDAEVHSGEFAMICIANGRWYGGGFNPLPVAELDDGYLDVLLVRGLSRFAVPGVIGKYKTGRFRELTKYISYHRCKRVEIISDRANEINLDGELLMAQNAVFEIVPGALRFFYPKGLTYRNISYEETSE